MSNDIRIKKGLDIKLVGEAVQDLEAPRNTHWFIKPSVK